MTSLDLEGCRGAKAPDRGASRSHVRTRRLFACGALAIASFTGAAVLFGTGCIFDSGGDYQGGGRRTPSQLPSAVDEETDTDIPTIPTDTARPSNDSGGTPTVPMDSGAG